MNRLEELADFLRNRRARLQPHQVGLKLSNRRRTPGLRREEVAELAGISSTWYSWLEQARPVNVSAATLQRIGQALNLDHDELVYIFGLAQLPLPVLENDTTERLAKQLEDIMYSMPGKACYLIGPRWDLISWNELADCVFSFSKLPGPRPNLIRTVFTNEHFRKLWTDWEHDAQEMVAHLRHDYHQNMHDKQAYEALIAELSLQSSEFKDFWSRHEVLQRAGWVKRLNHPKVGALQLQSLVLETSGHPYPRLIVYSGSSPSDSDLLARLKSRIS